MISTFGQYFTQTGTDVKQAACAKASRGRLELLALIEQVGVLEELHARFEAHLLERRRVGLDADAVERAVGSFERHVVGDERQVAVVNIDPVGLEHLLDLLKIHGFTCC